MGTHAHDALVVTSTSAKSVLTAHAIIADAFAKRGLGHLVTGIVPFAINEGASFAVMPSGSQVGWHRRDAYEKAMRDCLHQLKVHYPLLVHWVFVRIGGDDGGGYVIDSADSTIQKRDERTESGDPLPYQVRIGVNEYADDTVAVFVAYGPEECYQSSYLRTVDNREAVATALEALAAQLRDGKPDPGVCRRCGAPIKGQCHIWKWRLAQTCREEGTERGEAMTAKDPKWS